MKRTWHHIQPAITAIGILAGSTAFAQVTPSENTAAAGYCQDADTEGWNFYCKDVEPEPEPVEEEAPTAPPPPAPPPEEPPSYTEQMMEFRAQLDELKHKAILEPTPENVQAYMRAQNDAVQMAGAFTEVWQRSLFSNPELDANVKRPLTAIGSNLRQDQRNAEREAALQTASTEMGLMYVYDGPSTCLVCATQSRIIADMAAKYSIEVLPVSTDGYVATEFPQTVIDRGHLAQLGLTEHPRPFIALVDPRADDVQLIGAGLMTQDIILERVRIIVSVPEGELYE